MYEAKYENSAGQVLTLTGQEDVYQVLKITGLSAPKAAVSTTPVAGLAGALLNSTKLETRNIVIYIKINGDIEANRQSLYQIFRTGEVGTFFFRNDNRDVSIPCVTETLECDIFSDNEIAQVSLICPQPYFVDVDDIIEDISGTVAGFTFPFAIDQDDPVELSVYYVNRIAVISNLSDASTGVVIEADFASDVSEFRIWDVDSGEYILLTYAFEAGDRLIINTNVGQKAIRLIRGNSDINLFSAMDVGSTLLQLRPGDNRISYLADSGQQNGQVFVYLAFARRYRGV